MKIHSCNPSTQGNLKWFKTLNTWNPGYESQISAKIPGSLFDVVNKITYEKLIAEIGSNELAELWDVYNCEYN